MVHLGSDSLIWLKDDDCHDVVDRNGLKVVNCDDGGHGVEDVNWDDAGHGVESDQHSFKKPDYDEHPSLFPS